MASYDSDSSAGEDQEFTETDVLLGYASKDAQGESISRLGGRPDWLDPETPASAALARCKVCKALMVLLLQLNAELPDRFPGHDRRLYVFACRNKACRRRDGSIRAVRGVAVAENAPEVDAKKGREAKEEKKAPVPAVAPPRIGEALFGVKPLAGGANPFSAGAGANPFAKPTGGAVNPFSKPAPKQDEAATPTAPAPTSPAADSTSELPATFAQKLSLNNPQATSTGPPPPPEPWPVEADQPAPYPVRWLADADYETLDPTPDTQFKNVQVMDMDTEGAGDNASGSGGKEDKVVFESTMDAVFQKFADRVGQNPEQCIRYEFGGQPLLYSKSDAVGKLLHVGGDEKVSVARSFPRCPSCGAGRVFEVQLTPQAIEELEAEEDALEGMDWGTIIVAVCEKDCQVRGTKAGEAGYVEEWAGVQWEELTAQR